MVPTPGGHLNFQARTLTYRSRHLTKARKLVGLQTGQPQVIKIATKVIEIGGRGGAQGSVTGPFSYQHREDEDSFLIVDTRTGQKTKSFAPRNRFGTRIDRFNRRELERFQGEKRDKDPNAQVNQRHQQPKTGFAKRSGPGGWGRGGGAGNWHAQRRWEEQNRPTKDASIDIGSSWTTCGQAQFSALQKLTTSPPEGRTLREFGTVNFCDKSFLRLSTKTDRKIGHLEGSVYQRPTTSEDPVMRELAESGEGNVFATDTILATLMAAPRSVDPWDLVVTKRDGKIFFDKRKASSLEMLSTGETANDAPSNDKDGPNSASALARESTLVDQSFQKVLASEANGSYQLGPPSPLASGPPVAYRYRSFQLDEQTTVVSRFEVNGAIQGNDSTKIASIKALCEWDPKITGVNWRKSLDKQRGAILATEIRNNSFKLARWGINALLADVDQIQIGYVSRLTPRDATHHTVLGTQAYKPSELAAQMALNEKNVWGILEFFVAQVRDLDDGKYVILKDPNKAVIRIFAVPESEHAKLV